MVALGAIVAVAVCFLLPASSEKKRERTNIEATTVVEVMTVVEAVSEQDSSGVIEEESS